MNRNMDKSKIEKKTKQKKIRRGMEARKIHLLLPFLLFLFPLYFSFFLLFYHKKIILRTSDSLVPNPYQPTINGYT